MGPSSAVVTSIFKSAFLNPSEPNIFLAAVDNFSAALTRVACRPSANFFNSFSSRAASALSFSTRASMSPCDNKRFFRLSRFNRTASTVGPYLRRNSNHKFIFVSRFSISDSSADRPRAKRAKSARISSASAARPCNR